MMDRDAIQILDIHTYDRWRYLYGGNFYVTSSPAWSIESCYHIVLIMEVEDVELLFLIKYNT